MTRPTTVQASNLHSLFRTLSVRSAAPSTSRAAVTGAARAASSSSTTAAAEPTPIRSETYPFSPRAIVRQADLPTPAAIHPPPVVKHVTRGTIDTLHAELRTQYDPTGRYTAMFARNSASRIPPGSVLMVETWSNASKTTSSSFSGILLAVRRRGTSTSFVLRTLVQKLGVEVRFNIYSPLLKNINVISRADGTKADKSGRLQRARRAKLYYLRLDDRKIAGVGKIIQKLRLRSEREQEEAKTRQRILEKRM